MILGLYLARSGRTNASRLRPPRSPRYYRYSASHPSVSRRTGVPHTVEDPSRVRRNGPPSVNLNLIIQVDATHRISLFPRIGLTLESHKTDTILRPEGLVFETTHPARSYGVVLEAMSGEAGR